MQQSALFCLLSMHLIGIVLHRKYSREPDAEFIWMGYICQNWVQSWNTCLRWYSYLRFIFVFARIPSSHRRGKKRVTRMVTIVVLAFAICWLPIQVRKCKCCICCRMLFNIYARVCVFRSWYWWPSLSTSTPTHRWTSPYRSFRTRWRTRTRASIRCCTPFCRTTSGRRFAR